MLQPHSHIATAAKLSATLNITALNVSANEHITKSYRTCEMQSTTIMNPPQAPEVKVVKIENGLSLVQCFSCPGSEPYSTALTAQDTHEGRPTAVRTSSVDLSKHHL